MQAARDNLKWAVEDSPWIGCGEDYPIDEKYRDGYRSQTNRRVELLFFEPAEAAKLSGEPQKERRRYWQRALATIPKYCAKSFWDTASGLKPRPTGRKR